MINLQHLRGTEFLHDYGQIKKLGNEYKLTVFRSLRQRGIETDKSYVAKGEVNSEKQERSIQRTKQQAYELTCCNKWELFCTFTLDKFKYNRKELAKYIKDFTQFLRNFKRLHSCDIKYFMIPERHKDGAWHLHALLLGLPLSYLHKFSKKEKLPLRIKERIEQGKGVYTWEAYSKKFGFANIECIENLEATSKYILKYISKDLASTITELNSHMYYASHGLKKSELIYEGFQTQLVDKPAFENEYVTIKTSQELEALTRYLE